MSNGFKKSWVFIALIFITSIPLNSFLTINCSELTAECSNQEIPGSKKLHKRLDKPGFYEIKYATLTFKKKSQDQVYLTGFNLKWESKKEEKLPRLEASLFKVDSTNPDEFKPTPENLISEATWSDTQQELCFVIRDEKHMQKKIALTGISSFYIVLVVSPEIERKLHTGCFRLVPESLPEPFKNIAISKPLLLALHPSNELQKIS
mgnify:CR=1 FL=1